MLEEMSEEVESIMENRRGISYVLFGLGVLMVVIGLVSDEVLTGVLVGLAFAAGGLVFFRRGK